MVFSISRMMAAITNFKEKKKEDGGWINAGFMVLEPSIMDLIEGDETVFEKGPSGGGGTYGTAECL